MKQKTNRDAVAVVLDGTQSPVKRSFPTVPSGINKLQEKAWNDTSCCTKLRG